MIKHFEFIDDKSNKFWNIEKNNQKITINFGRIGSEKTKVEYKYNTKIQMDHEYKKKIESKINKMEHILNLDKYKMIGGAKNKKSKRKKKRKKSKRRKSKRRKKTKRR